MPSNDLRAAWADQALGLFQNITRTDREDALPDLLCNLMHLSVREGWDFDAALRRGEANFNAEVECPDLDDVVPRGRPFVVKRGPK